MSYFQDPAGSDTRFGSVRDFLFAMECGCETEFLWKGVHYGAVRYGTDNKVTVYVAMRPETEGVYDTAEEALDYRLGEDRLGDGITRVEVLYRTI